MGRRSESAGRGILGGVVATLAVAIACALPGTAAAAEPASRHEVVPVEWSRFSADLPGDAAAVRSRTILASAVRYGLTTWWTAKGFAGQQSEYLSFGGIAEGNIRPPASEALAIAALLSTGAYDAEAIGVPAGEARARAVRLVASLAHRHTATSPGGWGDHWQSALWAYYAGFAGWLVWEDLTPADRKAVERMLVHEAGRFIDYEVPYYRDESGAVVFPGDSKAEENAWNANLLQLTTAMLPRHPDQRLWMTKNLELMVSAFSRPADLDSGRILNGRPLRDWLRGSNIADDGTLVNHGFIHPDYMATSLHNNNAVLTYGLAGDATPEAALFNTNVVYRALVDLPFASPPFRAPGGTIYVDGSGDLYYPQGNDWGTSRRMHVALLDAQAHVLGLDGDASTPAAEWERLHAQRVLDMQSRFDDGRTYGAAAEDTYSGREEWVAVHAAQSWLTWWLDHNDAIRLTGRAYPIRPPDRARGTTEIEAPRYFPPGTDRTVTARFTNHGPGTAGAVRTTLALPAGWTAWPRADDDARVVRAGRTAEWSWDVRAPDGAQPARVVLATATTYRLLGVDRRTEARASAWLAPPVPVGSPFASDLEWLETTNGYGAIRRDVNFYGDPITIEDEVFERGIWTNAPSSIGFFVGGNCSRLTATVGIDDSMEAYGASRGSVVFQVFVDGVKRYDSGLVIGTTRAPAVDVDLTGADDVRLVATDGAVDGKSYDHAVWGAPLLSCG